MPRHAYCILAHNEPKVLEVLVELLDDERNDIYIHLDKKSDISQFRVQTKYSRCTFIPRIKVYWGGFSLTQATLNLLGYAKSHGAYSYYHLISGVDLPLKSQDYIHDFCDNEHSGKEFIGILNNLSPDYLAVQTRYYYIFESVIRPGWSGWGNRIKNAISWRIRHYQSRLGTHRKIKNKEIRKGVNWFSISDKMVSFILSNKKWIKKHFHHTRISDEIAISTLVWNSPFRSHIFNTNCAYLSCMRKIDWTRGNPYVWKSEDVYELINSNSLFARKFSATDIEAIESIKHHLKSAKRQ